MKIKATEHIEGLIKGNVYDVVDSYVNGKVVCVGGELIKVNYKNFEEVKGHPHADLIMEYAKIAQHDAEPWKHFEYYAAVGWVECSPLMSFNETVEYRLKPLTININGFEVPEPLRHEPSDGTDYYVLDMSEVSEMKWTSDVSEYQWLKAGIIHLTREAAEKHLEALLSFTKGW